MTPREIEAQAKRLRRGARMRRLAGRTAEGREYGPKRIEIDGTRGPRSKEPEGCCSMGRWDLAERQIQAGYAWPCYPGESKGTLRRRARRGL